MATTKADLETKYNVPCYVRWNLVPINLHPRSWYLERNVKISKTTKPDAVKDGGMQFVFGQSRVTFLFNERKYLDAETLRQLNLERRLVI